MSKELAPTENSEVPSIEEFKYDILVALGRHAVYLDNYEQRLNALEELTEEIKEHTLELRDWYLMLASVAGDNPDPKVH
jgi:hypothetical protein|tara:strand:+ start:412 stop:648 length:237 start_codon:yes stop_codon:yes gene_type:complete